MKRYRMWIVRPLALAAVVLIAVPVAANASTSCQRARYNAAAKYAACELKAVGRHFDFSSQTYVTPTSSNSAWEVAFDSGSVEAILKSIPLHLRAVRNGS